MRTIRTLMNGWLKYKNHPEARIRKRFAKEKKKLLGFYAGALWATRRWFKDNPRIAQKMTDTLEDIYKEFGLKSRLAAPVLGGFIFHRLRKEEKRLADGYTYEPPTFCETSVKVVCPTIKATS